VTELLFDIDEIVRMRTDADGESWESVGGGTWGPARVCNYHHSCWRPPTQS